MLHICLTVRRFVRNLISSKSSTKGKRPLGRPSRRWEDGIRIDIRETGWGCELDSTGWGCELDSTGSGQGPVAGCCECGDEPSGSCATELVS
jgi:hypothetical protein